MSILPYLLQKENIAHVQDGILYIGDRRTFPFQRTFFPCHDAGEIAFALRSMVTQGGGPLQVALTALPFLARKAGSFPELQEMMDLIKASRRTNTTMARTIDGLLEKVKDGRDMEERLSLLVEEQEAKFQSEYELMGKAGALLLPQEARVLTTCFAEHSFLLCLQYAREIGKKVVVMVNETRPYLQGSRLTAPSLKELGFEVSLITDGMGAHYMAENEINVYMTACDVLCKDGTVVNKVGTLNNAIAAKHYKIPYYVFALSPDFSKKGMADLVMEQRDGSEITHCLGQWTTEEGIDAKYPAFDCIPCSLVSRVVTPRGVFKPEKVEERDS